MNTSGRTTVRFSINSTVDVDIAALKTAKLKLIECFPESERSILATVVSELGRNIIKYAGSGSIRLTQLDESMRCGVQILSVDHGPGISDVELAMQDHFSTSGTLGLGLPGVRRMMDEFKIESDFGKGTCVTARKWTKKKR